MEYGLCYGLLTDMNLAQNDAEAECESQGATLAVLDSQDKMDFLANSSIFDGRGSVGHANFNDNFRATSPYISYHSRSYFTS